MTHDEITELLGAFALDAVEPDEALAVAQHLTGCPRCREEVAQHHQVAGVLASSGGEASPAVWDGIAARLVDSRSSPGPTRLPPFTPRSIEGPGRPTIGAARSRLGRRLAALAAAAAVAAIAILGVEIGRLDHRLNQVAAATATQNLTGAARTALLDPQSRRVVLSHRSPGSPVLAEVVTLNSGAAYLFDRGLPALPAGQTYQLWNITGNRAVSLGLLGTDPGTVAFTVAPAASVGTLALTVEPAQGSVAPTLPAVATSIG
jgi:hypothetical protein